MEEWKKNPERLGTQFLGAWLVISTGKTLCLSSDLNGSNCTQQTNGDLAGFQIIDSQTRTWTYPQAYLRRHTAGKLMWSRPPLPHAAYVGVLLSCQQLQSK
ncbi:hypothetical protein E2C01_044780 [Portunus trituberculatus]|uniref:Uncharacterized protein n=1 Tax=Portunus trituberculatus TaxID=210409 RepID=A0A5B7G044_PORTR|nr:hypothetical protein [Portunus trituberculatus]